jgi:hypothetical protein
MRFSTTSRSLGCISVVAFLTLSCCAQTMPDKAHGNDAEIYKQLQSQIRELQAVVSELRAESARYRTETERLRQEVQAIRSVQPLSSADSAMATTPQSTPSVDSSTEHRLADLEDEQQILKDKVDEQYQTKVESASKYRVRLSGIVLMNAFSNQGSVDSTDIPTLALRRGPLDSAGNAGGTVRQSILGLEAFGPVVAGAKTSADIQFDLAGGFQSSVQNGVTSGLLRIRTGVVRLDWKHFSAVAGQDTLFIAPEAPTSFASLAVPALAYSGNLWSWVPQLLFEYRINTSDVSRFTLQGGILDPLTGEAPASEYLRRPTAGENARRPGYGARVAWSHRTLDRDFTIGAAGYYSRQDWGFGRIVNGWAGMSDWEFPLASWLKLTGEFYRGQAIGGLGGGVGRSVLFSGVQGDQATVVRGLNDIGGWTQLKFRPAPKIEFNTAIGQDSPFSKQLRSFSVFQAFNSPLWSRNRSGFVNAIYRPRSDLLLSVEFRRIQTSLFAGETNSANHVNLAMGFLF